MHEVLSEDSCHTETVQCVDVEGNHEHPETKDHQASPCSFHCHFLHALALAPDSEQSLEVAGTHADESFLYDGLDSKQLALELLRPPIVSSFI